jgi:hypothetical protein
VFMPSTNVGKGARRNLRRILSDAAVRRFAIVGGIGLLGCVIARAPTLIGKFTVPKLGLDLSLNAGYVVIFGSLILFAGTLWAAYGTTAAKRADQPQTLPDCLFIAVLFVFPALTAAFLALQFFLLLAPKGECLTFDRLRYLTDLALQPFQPEYCMGVSSEAQQGQPWLLQPPILEGWLQVLLPLATLAVALWARRRWTERRS